VLKTFHGVALAGGSPQGVPALARESIQSCDVDIRRELYNGIILTGSLVLRRDIVTRVYQAGLRCSLR